MSLVTWTLIGIVVSNLFILPLLITYIVRLHKDVDYLKKKIIKVESLAERARSNAYLARRSM